MTMMIVPNEMTATRRYPVGENREKAAWLTAPVKVMTIAVPMFTTNLVVITLPPHVRLHGNVLWGSTELWKTINTSENKKTNSKLQQHIKQIKSQSEKSWDMRNLKTPLAKAAQSRQLADSHKLRNKHRITTKRAALLNIRKCMEKKPTQLRSTARN